LVVIWRNFKPRIVGGLLAHCEWPLFFLRRSSILASILKSDLRLVFASNLIRGSSEGVLSSPTEIYFW
ncbi:hypothetical protein QE152_g40372, partial [Popillia japonica]